MDAVIAVQIPNNDSGFAGSFRPLPTQPERVNATCGPLGHSGRIAPTPSGAVPLIRRQPRRGTSAFGGKADFGLASADVAVWTQLRHWHVIEISGLNHA